MKFLSWVGNWKLWGVLAGIIVVLLGLVKIQSLKNDALEAEQEELEEQMELSQHNHKVKEFQAINNERKDEADEKLDKALDELDTKLNGNTTYSV